ncbi:hypothetical protein [Bordetella flabilis]|uniref:Phage tail protein n=1 Tax=Bordetella flabilis TaxID=463014 RepID=A0A193GBZ9_9BORD|nr:hypothetical protein [Bordetella flabilis]ANN76799.1 hypothetical protein BAU07_06440 [Bordetella flabilis]
MGIQGDFCNQAQLMGLDPAQLKSSEQGQTWSTLPGKPAVVAAGADQASARAAIGAGTSNLALGTTATTALAGNGTAAAATKLATARTINSVAFDGTANITFDATKIQAPAFTTAGGTAIAAGTIAEQLTAIGDIADPA